jgi:uncharacterized membrane protein YcaP (DUF421 family)
MKPEEIHLSDLARILIGNVPGAFYFELILRAAFFYVLLVACMRLLGKRMSSQLSRNEMATLVALAASIGIPLTAPDRGILPGLISCIVIVLVSRFLANRFSKSEKMETLTQGTVEELVADGVLQLDALKNTNLSRDRVLAELRSQGLKQLGRVKRLYFEVNGSFTLVQDPGKKAGLNILPQEDPDYINQQRRLPGRYVCEVCGKPKPPSRKVCDNCGNASFTEAISED